MIFRILISLFIFGVPFASKVSAQSTEIADSLFRSKKYTEAFLRYDSIFQKGQASPAMLVKMAYIKEGLGNYTDALYYLDHYYKKTGNKRALEKMRDLAKENDLTGYEYSDYKFMVSNINKYHDQIILAIFGLSLIVLVIIYIKRPKGYLAMPWVVLLIILLAPVAMVNNDLLKTKEAIINQDQTMLMEGPAAGSEALGVITKGNKVRVIKEFEIWTQIESGEQTAFVRTTRLLKLL